MWLSGSCLRALTMVAALLTPSTAALAAETAPDASPAAVTDAVVRCETLAAIVADVCPQRCVRKHCTQRCIPPLNEDGRCERCQDHCAQICESQADMRLAACGAPDDTGEPTGADTATVADPPDDAAATPR